MKKLAVAILMVFTLAGCGSTLIGFKGCITIKDHDICITQGVHAPEAPKAPIHETVGTP